MLTKQNVVELRTNLDTKLKKLIQQKQFEYRLVPSQYYPHYWAIEFRTSKKGSWIPASARMFAKRESALKYIIREMN